MLRKLVGILLGAFILLLPYTAFAAIAFDNTGSASNAGPGVNTGSASISVGSLTNGIGLACIWGSNSAPTGVTWGGNAMTLIQDYNTTSFADFSLYGILAPASGVTTVTANFAGSQNKVSITAVSYQGVKQSLTLDSVANVAESSTNSYAMAGTAVAANAWGGACTINNTNTSAPTAGTNTTLRTATHRAADAVWVASLDSNATVSGSFTLNQTNATTGSTDGIVFSFAPPASPFAPVAPLIMTFD